MIQIEDTNFLHMAYHMYYYTITRVFPTKAVPMLAHDSEDSSRS